MAIAESALDGDGARVLDFVLANSVNRLLLERLPSLGLLDWLLVAGCVFQSVWNGLVGRSPGVGIVDYDVFYFDASDLSWEAEDRVIRACAEAFGDVGAEVQVRNQARVHLWYEQKFGVPCAPLRSARDGVDAFLNQSSCLGVGVGPDGGFELYAPFGLADLLGMVVRPNRRRELPEVYYAKAARWREEWPSLRIVAW